MERLRTLAFQTIGRAVGFAGLAIFCVMVGLAFDPLMAVRAGGILVFILLVVLLYKARAALTADHRQTEMWLYLEKDEKPAEAYAQWAASTVLRDAYIWFARWAAGVAVFLWAVAVLLSAFGIRSAEAVPVFDRQPSSVVAPSQAQRSDWTQDLVIKRAKHIVP
jgi:type IV secretory pathway VirB3-like protein